jgi:UTP:GlnB (protein PII) uridylyltransferase
LKSFSCTVAHDRELILEIRTPSVKEGTLYRLSAAIYSLDLDIYSGDIDTVEEEGELFSHDRFVLRTMVDGSARKLSEIGLKLGMLMEALLSSDSDPEELIRNSGKEIPRPESFFDAGLEVLFDRNTERGETMMYLEAPDRPGLLFTMTKLLYHHDVNIISATLRSTYGGHARDLFHLQSKGKPLNNDTIEALSSFLLQFTKSV